MRRWSCWMFIVAGMGLGLNAATAAGYGAFEIVIVPGSSLEANPAALAAVERGARRWTNFIADPIRININADFSSLPGDAPVRVNNIIFDLDFDAVRAALIAKKSADPLFAALPTRAQFSANLADGNSLLPDLIGISRANQKALGLISSDTNSDGTILFNPSANFDFDSSNGVAADAIDMETMAARLIGHVLGFFSNVDDFDVAASVSDPSVLDLFRFPADAVPSSVSEFTTFAREMRPGADAVLADLNDAWPVSTGAQRGDGHPASYWKANALPLGVMDPVLATGRSVPMSLADMRAIELIGYSIVPEPALLSFLGLLALFVRARRTA